MNELICGRCGRPATPANPCVQERRQFTLKLRQCDPPTKPGIYWWRYVGSGAFGTVEVEKVAGVLGTRFRVGFAPVKAGQDSWYEVVSEVEDR